MPANRPTLIALDEDPQSLKEIEDIASAQFNVVKVRRADQVAILLQSQSSVAVLVVNQTLTGGSGLAILTTAQTMRPAVRRVLIAGPGNLAETIEGLHSGAVERIIYKPIRSAEVLPAITLPPTTTAPVRATA